MSVVLNRSSIRWDAKVITSLGVLASDTSGVVETCKSNFVVGLWSEETVFFEMKQPSLNLSFNFDGVVEISGWTKSCEFGESCRIEVVWEMYSFLSIMTTPKLLSGLAMWMLLLRRRGLNA